MNLPRFGSNDGPIQLEVVLHRSNPRPFHYELVWSAVDGCQDLAHQWWTELSTSGCGAFIFFKKGGGRG